MSISSDLRTAFASPYSFEKVGSKRPGSYRPPQQKKQCPSSQSSISSLNSTSRFSASSYESPVRLSKSLKRENSPFKSPRKGQCLGTINLDDSTEVTGFAAPSEDILSYSVSPSKVKSPMKYHDLKEIIKKSKKQNLLKIFERRKHLPQHTFMHSPSRITEKIREALKIRKNKTRKENNNHPPNFNRSPIFLIKETGPDGKLKRNYLRVHDGKPTFNGNNHVVYPMNGHNCVVVPGYKVRKLYEEFYTKHGSRSINPTDFKKFLQDRIKENDKPYNHYATPYYLQRPSSAPSDRLK